MTPKQAQKMLADNGFPVGAIDGAIGPRTMAAIRKFQEAFHNPGEIAVTGVLDGPTMEALGKLPMLSPHFAVAELRSAGNGDCYVRRELLAGLEQLRAVIGRPLPLRSAYRDPAHNAEVGGATNSMHLHGLAADIPGDLRLSVGQVQALGVFAGIGDKAGIVLHVDCRDRAGANNLTPEATGQRPARWHY